VQGLVNENSPPALISLPSQRKTRQPESSLQIEINSLLHPEGPLAITELLADILPSIAVIRSMPLSQERFAAIARLLTNRITIAIAE
jgi:hypothetical protein